MAEHDGSRSELRADCSRCAGLCCVLPAFSASADFAIDKEAGEPCPNLRTDFRCGIHSRLRQQGFPGCAVYDCFGAGQKVTQLPLAGQEQTSAVFAVMRQLHELLWYLTEALALEPARPLRGALRLALEDTERLSLGRPDDLMELDVAAHRHHVNALLLRASELARAGRRGADRRGADLVGRDLRRTDLRGASLRGARLIGADLRGADLHLADLTGADLRGADLRRADLTGTLFLTQSQLDAAKGDAATRLPAARARPAHWSAVL